MTTSIQLLGKTLKPKGPSYILPRDGNILKAYNSQDKHKKPMKVFKKYNIYVYGFDKKSKRYFIDCDKVTSKSSEYIFLFKSRTNLFLMWHKERGKIIFNSNTDTIVNDINIHYAEHCMEELPFTTDVFDIIGQFAPKKTRLLSRRTKKIADPHFYATQTFDYLKLIDKYGMNWIKKNGYKIRKLKNYSGDELIYIEIDEYYLESILRKKINLDGKEYIQKRIEQLFGGYMNKYKSTKLYNNIFESMYCYFVNNTIAYYEDHPYPVLPIKGKIKALVKNLSIESIDNMLLNERVEDNSMIPDTTIIDYFPNLTHLKLNNTYNRLLILPESLTHFSMSRKYTSYIKLPTGLTNLTMGRDYYHPIIYPEELKYLTIERINDVNNNLPKGLKYLKINGDDWHDSIINTTYPDSLKELYICTTVRNKGLILPDKLKKFSASMSYWPILPKSLTDINMSVHKSTKHEPDTKYLPKFHEGLKVLTMPFSYYPQTNKLIKFPKSLKLLNWSMYGARTISGKDQTHFPKFMVSKNTEVFMWDDKHKDKIQRYNVISPIKVISKAKAKVITDEDVLKYCFTKDERKDYRYLSSEIINANNNLRDAESNKHGYSSSIQIQSDINYYEGMVTDINREFEPLKAKFDDCKKELVKGRKYCKLLKTDKRLSVRQIREIRYFISKMKNEAYKDKLIELMKN